MDHWFKLCDTTAVSEYQLYCVWVIFFKFCDITPVVNIAFTV